MRVGGHLPSWASNQSKLPASRFKRFAQKAETNGLSTIWAGDHLVKPPTYRTSWLDPLTTLSSVSNVTENIQLGTSILILPLRNPILVAKRAQTLQHLCEERLVLGIGLGYIEEDFKAANASYKNRAERFTESLELLYKLLHEKEVTYEGEFYSVDNLTLEPETSRPPKILLAGSGAERDGERRVSKGIKKRLQFADGWIGPTHITPQAAESDWTEMKEYLRDNGENPHDYETVVATQMYIVPNASSETAKKKQRQVFSQHIGESRDISFAEDHYTFGTVDEIVTEINEFKKSGFDELNIMFAPHNLNELDRQLDVFSEYVLPEI